jgi:predicted lipoprotein with Yx(FWY)xxD motif
VGARGLKEDTFEVSWRKDGEKQMIPIAETGEWLVQWVKDAMQGKR